MKTQSIRLADVYVIGPLMIWSGYKLVREYPLQGAALGLMGLGTILYNWRNYLEARGAE